MMTLNTLIVDDEPLASRGLQVRLQAYDDINIVALCGNGREAIEAIRAYQIDLVFLDIQMPGLNGFEVIEEIQKQGLHLPHIVFVTAYDQYALKAFEVHALDYIMKPVDVTRLDTTLAKIRSHISSNTDADHKAKLVRLVSDVTGNDYQQILSELANNKPVSLYNYSDVLAIKDGSEVTRVPVKDITWIDAAGDYMCVHTRLKAGEQRENTHILRKTMKELELLLDPKIFIRNHRSTIVNKQFISKFCNQLNGEYFLVLYSGKELKVSRSYKEKVKQAINC